MLDLGHAHRLISIFVTKEASILLQKAPLFDSELVLFIAIAVPVCPCVLIQQATSLFYFPHLPMTVAHVVAVMSIRT